MGIANIIINMEETPNYFPIRQLIPMAIDGNLYSPDWAFATVSLSSAHRHSSPSREILSTDARCCRNI